MLVGVALVLAIFSFIAFSAGKKAFGWLFGIAGFLTFIIWLKSGPGFSVLDFIKDPSVDVPDNIPIPGGK